MQDIALAAPEVVARYRGIGDEAPELSPAQFGTRIQSETLQWRDIIRAAALRLD